MFMSIFLLSLPQTVYKEENIRKIGPIRNFARIIFRQLNLSQRLCLKFII